jgi:hypothetical protein
MLEAGTDHTVFLFGAGHACMKKNSMVKLLPELSLLLKKFKL